ncbi:MAG TPA: sulfatase [Thermoanaerobaculia bacterium]|nr:sulfatase [Thermoanaerobaculia bacterium]
MRASSTRPRPSIVLISVDTLRADHLACYGYARPTSPFIDSLAQRGTLFEEAQVPRPATSPSHASLLTGVMPRGHGVLANGMVMKTSVDTLAAALKRAGYETAASVAVSHIGRKVGFARRFDHFLEPTVTDPNSDTRRFGEAVNADVRSMIDAHLAARNGKPLFLFVHYFECHYPYRAWDKSEKTDPWNPAVQADRPRQLMRYDDGIRRVDERIRELHDYVTAKLGPNVVFCITADHGEQIGDHGLAVGHADIYRETVRVPLILSGPELPRGVRVKTAVSTMDVPVFLARLGGARFVTAVDGHDLGPLIERSASWLPQLFSSAPKRLFLITGAPAYTRSIALIDGSSWYIKNFDYTYPQAWIDTPAAQEAARGEVVPVS